ncbi:uncharacterized protein LOC128243409 [Mya arenaria]|uniref:uncharacterized protein LOC128243409 n=1 Tax=Mya arenaria TaxID=6604 RepID=UPI0022E11984|nr:uncharacterized protein LOC128243409 [Mya arenaria]
MHLLRQQLPSLLVQSRVCCVKHICYQRYHCLIKGVYSGSNSISAHTKCLTTRKLSYKILIPALQEDKVLSGFKLVFANKNADSIVVQAFLWNICLASCLCLVFFVHTIFISYKEAAEKKLGIKDDFAKDRDECDLAKNRGEDDLAENVKKVVEFDPVITVTVFAGLGILFGFLHILMFQTNLLRMYYNSRKDAFCAVILKDGLYKRYIEFKPDEVTVLKITQPRVIGKSPLEHVRVRAEEFELTRDAFMQPRYHKIFYGFKMKIPQQQKMSDTPENER